MDVEATEVHVMGKEMERCLSQPWGPSETPTVASAKAVEVGGAAGLGASN